jgi:hypothetical protein
MKPVYVPHKGDPNLFRNLAPAEQLRAVDVQGLSSLIG